MFPRKLGISKQRKFSDSGSRFWLLYSGRTVQLLPVHLAWETKRASHLIRWEHITNIVQTSEYLFSCQNAPSAIAVPKSAFPNQEQVLAFIEQAENYWRHETGCNDVPPAENTGVWLPAPRVDASQEKA